MSNVRSQMAALNLATVEIKAFVPARDFELSKQFYTAAGFTMAFSSEELAYFDDPSPRSIELQDGGATLYVEYRFGHIAHAGLVNITATRFFLVPRTEAQLRAKGIQEN
jgi:hypothetical protein